MKSGTTKVRQSKFRHLFGEPWPATDCMNSAKVGSIQIEANILKTNSKYLAFPGSIRGTICALPLTYKGAIDNEAPLFIHEDNTLNEFNFNPFDESMIVSGLQDGTVAVWKIPEGGLTENTSSPVTSFTAHEKRVMNIEFHPLASNLLITGDSGKEVKIWDLNAQAVKLTLPDVFKSTVTNISWNADGSLAAIASKDKKLRIFDPRGNKLVGEVDDHPGSKGSRCLWFGSKDKIFSVGFNKSSDRQYLYFDPRNFAQPLLTQKIDSSPSTLLPFYDDDLGLLYLAGKGDANVRFFEVVDEDPFLYSLGEFKSKDPQSGFALLPKRVVDTKKCETSRFLKLTPAGQIIPIRFIVPRQDFGIFQEDIYPDTLDGTASMTSDEWLGGANTSPTKKSMNPEKQ